MVEPTTSLTDEAQTTESDLGPMLITDLPIHQQSRKLLLKLGCRTAADISKLQATQLLTEPYYGRGRLSAMVKILVELGIEPPQGVRKSKQQAPRRHEGTEARRDGGQKKSGASVPQYLGASVALASVALASVPSSWFDHSSKNREIMEAEIAWAMEDLLGMPRGLVRGSFLDRARATIREHYPRLRKSSLRQAFESSKAPISFIPVHLRQNFERRLRLLDLIETMVQEGTEKAQRHEGTKQDVLSASVPDASVPSSCLSASVPDASVPSSCLSASVPDASVPSSCLSASVPSLVASSDGDAPN